MNRHVFDKHGDPFGQRLIVFAPGVRQCQEDLSPGIERLLTAQPMRLAALLLRPVLLQPPLPLP